MTLEKSYLKRNMDNNINMNQKNNTQFVITSKVKQ